MKSQRYQCWRPFIISHEILSYFDQYYYIFMYYNYPRRQKWNLKILKNNYTIPINTVYWACDTLPRSHAHVIVIGPCCACALRFNFSETVKVSNIYNEKNLTSNIAHSFDNGVKTIQKWIYIIHWIISTSNICFEYFDFVLSIGFSIYYYTLYNLLNRISYSSIKLKVIEKRFTVISS